MNITQAHERAELYARTNTLIERLAAGGRDDLARDALLRDLHAYQRTWVAPFARYCRGRNEPQPALPTDAFRFARISSRDPQDDLRTFESSGTTQQERSRHAFADLSLYDKAAYAAARYMLFPQPRRLRLIVLAPSESTLPSSSLSYMLARLVAWFGDEHSRQLWPLDEANVTALQASCAQAQHDGVPLALLGTSFAFVYMLDALSRSFTLPEGSRIMHTGGFKGRSRTLAPEALRRALAEKFALDERCIISEYGMTELSSQLYETTLRDKLMGPGDACRTLWSPGWLRVSVVHPESLLPLPEGEPGLVRIDDAANLDTVCALQTADLGVMEHGGLTLLGRAEGAVARGCSITAEQLLSENLTS